MSTKWKVDKDGFREKYKNNEYAEYDLDDQYTLVKDVDSQPYIVGEPVEDPGEMQQYLDDLLCDSGLLEYDMLHYDESNSSENMSIWHIDYARIIE